MVIPLDQNWINLPDTGILRNFTITPYKVNDRSIRKTKSQIIGMLQIDGSNTAIINKVLNANPSDVKIGMKMKIEWNKNPKGNPSDIKGFVKI
jgi:uncharacterized OB-fold protein